MRVPLGIPSDRVMGAQGQLGDLNSIPDDATRSTIFQTIRVGRYGLEPDCNRLTKNLGLTAG